MVLIYFKLTTVSVILFSFPVHPVKETLKLFIYLFILINKMIFWKLLVICDFNFKKNDLDMG